MGLFSGLAKVGKNALDFVTAPARTAAKVVGTGLKTGGNVLGELAEGDLKGAASAYGNGFKEQVGNVTGYYKEQFGNVKDAAGGYGEAVRGGVGLIGEPIRTGVRLTGNGLSSTGNVLTNLGEGNLSGAGGAYVNGWKNAGGIVEDHVQNQFNNLF